MKKLLLVTLFAILLIVQGIYAADIVYISQTSATSCDNYGPNDKAYCTQLENLGYELKYISETAVNAQSSIWTDIWNPSITPDPPKVIFLGDITESKAGSVEFCDLIDNTGKIIFSTGVNNFYNATFKGCVFREEYFDSVGTKNSCESGTLKVITGSYITGDLPVGENEDLDNILYVDGNKPGVLYVTKLGGHIRYQCTPNTITDIFTVLDLNDDAVYWGLDNPISYTEATWGVFDRTVQQILSPETLVNLNGTIITDSNTYKPAQYINITFIPNVTIENTPLVKLQRIGTTTTTSFNMIDNGQNWTKSIPIATNSANGTYSLIVTVSGFSGEVKKNIDIIPYKLAIATDDYSYSPGEDVKISIKITEAYNSDLKIEAEIDIENPGEEKTRIIDKEIPHTFVTNYTLSDTAAGGKYKIIIGLIDGDNRIINRNLEFVVKSSANLNATPSQWNTNTKTGKSVQTFTIGNKGNKTITSLSITSNGDCKITTNKNSLTNILSNKNANFTATSELTEEGECNGQIILKSTEIEYYIPVKIKYTPEAITDSLVLSPSSMSVYTIPGKTISKEFTIDNIADVNTRITGYSKSDSIKDIVSIKSVPSTVGADKSEDMNIEIDTADLTPETYSGTISISSDVGNDTSSISIIIIENIYDETDSYLDELTGLMPSIEALKKKDGYDGLITTYNNIESDFESAKEKYSEEDYETAYTLFEGAKRSLSDLKDDIEIVATEKKDYGGIIWGFAAIVIIGIVGILIWRYKDKIMEIINNMLGKKKYEEQQPEYYPPEEPQEGDYRTDYY